MEEDYFTYVCRKRNKRALDATYLSDEDQLFIVKTLTWWNHASKRHAVGRQKADYKIEIGFYEGLSINAFASTLDGRDAIAISWGAVLTLRELFSNAVHSPMFFWVEKNEREHMIEWLLKQALDFLFYHEMGHIWHGHTGLLAQNGVASFIEEAGAIRSSGLTNLDWQTLEFDADSFAATNSIINAIEHRVPTQFQPHDNPRQSSLMFAMLAIYLMYRQTNKEAGLSRINEFRHPSPPIRCRIIGQTFAEGVKQSNWLTHRELFDAIFQGQFLAEDVYAYCERREVNMAEFEAAMSEEVDAYFNKLLENWKVLLPELELLKRGGTLPPGQVTC